MWLDGVFIGQPQDLKYHVFVEIPLERFQNIKKIKPFVLPLRPSSFLPSRRAGVQHFVDAKVKFEKSQAQTLDRLATNKTE